MIGHRSTVNVAVRSSRQLAALAAINLFSLLHQTPALADTSGDSASQLDEIIVSARKKDERLVDVPASIEVISAQTIDQQRINNVDSLFGKVPSLYFSSNFLSPSRDYVNLVIRGIGAQSAGVPAIGTYIDGVYQPSLGFDIGFLDLERVEVLEGPQGTLFGRNTEGGALSIVTRKPTQDFHAQFQSSYDSFNTFEERLSISGGLMSQLAGSFAVDYSHTDGFLKARGVQEELAAIAPDNAPSIPADDMRKAVARGALRWLPSDGGPEVNFTMDESDALGHEGLPGVPVKGLPDGRGDSFASDPYGVYSDFQIDAHDQNHGAALTVDQDIGFAKFTSITGYRYLTSMSPFDFDGGIDYLGNYHDLRQKQDFYSQEFRLTSTPATALSWVGGLFAFDEDDNQYRAYNLASVPIYPGIDIPEQKQQIKRVGYAAFGQASWTPLQPLEITAGLRYSWEKARSDFSDNLTIPSVGYSEGGTVSAKASFSNISPTASIRYKLDEDRAIYARYAKGYKPGGYPSAPGLGTDIEYKAETSDNYEVGFKGEFFERMFSANLSLYDIEIHNQQLSTIVYYENLPVAAVGNAGKSRSRGAELALAAHPLTGLTLGVNAGYTDARYIAYTDTAGKNRAGEDFPFVPKATASATADYEMPVFGGWTASAGTTYKYVGSILSGTGVDLDLQFPVPSYSQLDLRAGLAKDHWRIDGFIDNVTDRYIILRIWNTFFFPDPPARPFATVAPPRRYGVRLTYNF